MLPTTYSQKYNIFIQEDLNCLIAGVWKVHRVLKGYIHRSGLWGRSCSILFLKKRRNTALIGRTDVGKICNSKPASHHGKHQLQVPDISHTGQSITPRATNSTPTCKEHIKIVVTAHGFKGHNQVLWSNVTVSTDWLLTYKNAEAATISIIRARSFPLTLHESHHLLPRSKRQIV